MTQQAGVDARKSGQPLKVAVVIVPGFSYLSLGSLLAPLHYVENTLLPNALSVSVFGEDGLHSAEPNDLIIQPSHTYSDLSEALDSLRGPDTVFFCCGHDVPMPSRDSLRRLFRKCKRTGMRVFGIGSANWIMAETRTLPNGQGAVHWSSLDAFAERNVDFEARNELFVTDGKTTSCAGELATLDLTIDFLRQEFGNQVANAACNHFLISYARSSNSLQPGATENRLRHAPLIAQSMVKMLRDTLTDDVSLDEVAAAHCISKRQMERIFNKYLDATPGKYLRKIKVELAYQLVEQTEMSVLEIAFACGYHSHSILSRHFREEYGVTPRDLREAKAQATKPL